MRKKSKAKHVVDYLEAHFNAGEEMVPITTIAREMAEEIPSGGGMRAWYTCINQLFRNGIAARQYMLGYAKTLNENGYVCIRRANDEDRKRLENDPPWYELPLDAPQPDPAKEEKRLTNSYPYDTTRYIEPGSVLSRERTGQDNA